MGWSTHSRVRIVPNRLGQVPIQDPKNFGRTFFRCHDQVNSRELDWRARAHEQLETGCCVVQASCRVVVGTLADVPVAAAIDEDRRWRHAVLLRALVQANVGAVESRYSAVRGSEVNAKVVLRVKLAFLSIAVPDLTMPTGPIRTGSIT